MQKKFTVRVTGHWHRLPRGVVESHLGRYSRLVWMPICAIYCRLPALARVWTWCSLEVPSNSSGSVIPWIFFRGREQVQLIRFVNNAAYTCPIFLYWSNCENSRTARFGKEVKISRRWTTKHTTFGHSKWRTRQGKTSGLHHKYCKNGSGESIHLCVVQLFPFLYPYHPRKLLAFGWVAAKGHIWYQGEK